MKNNRTVRRSPPHLISTMLFCFVISLLWVSGPDLTNALLIRFYSLLGYTTPERIVDIYSLTGLPLVRIGFGASVGASLWTLFRYIRWRPKSIRARQLIDRGGTIAAWMIAVAALAFSLPLWISSGSMRPSDEIYGEAFPSSRSSLNELVRLLKAHPKLAELNQIPQIASEDSHPMDSALERRYRKLLVAATISRVTVSPDGNYRFQEWRDSGFMPWSEESGYCFAETPPANVLPDLTGLSFPYHSTYSAARHIRGNWYIYYLQRRPGD